MQNEAAGVNQQGIPQHPRRRTARSLAFDLPGAAGQVDETETMSRPELEAAAAQSPDR